jgi:multiple sugar transport system substrate-binding protein
VSDLFSSALSRRTFLSGALAVGAGATLAACSSSGSGGSTSSSPSAATSSAAGAATGTINALFMKQAGYSEDHVRAMTTAFKAANPGVTVNLEFVPYEALHDKIVAASAAGTYDLVLIDVIWPAEFATKGLVTDITDRIPSTWSNDVLAGALDSGLYQGKYYAVPWLLDTKYFYANKDMLTKAGVDPASLGTWDGVTAAAQSIKTKLGMKYPLIWSWPQSESVICDWAVLTASMGGKLFDDKGQPAFTAGGAVQALEFMRKTIVDGITNPSSTQSAEDDVRKVISAGDAAMGLNWTYMYAAANDPKQSKVANQITISPVPSGGSGQISVNGSMAMAITSGAQNPDAAWAFAQYLSSEKLQEQYVTDSLPIWKASYDNPEVVKSAPDVVAAAKVQLGQMVNRPQVANYNAVSAKLQEAVQKALIGDLPVQQALDNANTEVQKLLTA